MEKELKKILSILIAMMLSVSLMACGKAADSQTQTKEEDNHFIRKTSRYNYSAGLW